MKILHPTAFSQAAEKARLLAISLQQAFSASLHIVHVQRRFEDNQGVVSTAIDEVHPPLQEHGVQVKQSEVQKLRERLKMLTPENASHELIWGRPLKELLRIAPDYDLVVMSAHGDNPLDSFFVGGVAGRFMRRSPVPVLTVRPSWEVVPVKRVLIASDFGDASKHAFEWAKQLPAFGIDIVTTHVIEPSAIKNTHNFNLTRLALEAFSEGLASQELLRDGQAVKVLPKIAQEVDAQLIVIGSQRHSNAMGLLMGSRADGLLRSSKVPILTVPHIKKVAKN